MSESIDDQEQFQYWLAHMDDALEEFLARLPAQVRGALDYSPASLDVLESWLLDRYPSVSAIMSDAAQDDHDGAARYVGEVYRKALGGRWRIRYDDPKYVFYGLPEVTFLEKKDSPVSPMSEVTASADRRTVGYLARSFNGVKNSIERNRPPQ